MLINLWCVKTHGNIHCGGIKIKNTMHTCFFCSAYHKIENLKILNGHHAKILPKENLSKPTGTTNL